MINLNSSPYLKPGDLYTSATGEVLKTTVGSCISVCLFDPVNSIGGMNHYMFSESSSSCNDNKCGDIAIPNLIRDMIKKGAVLKNLRASLVGGGSSFSSVNKLSAGKKNINMAESILKKEGIPIVYREIGGCHGRRVLFYTDINKLEITELEDCMALCNKKEGSCRYRIVSS